MKIKLRLSTSSSQLRGLNGSVLVYWFTRADTKDQTIHNSLPMTRKQWLFPCELVHQDRTGLNYIGLNYIGLSLRKQLSFFAPGPSGVSREGRL